MGNPISFLLQTLIIKSFSDFLRGDYLLVAAGAPEREAAFLNADRRFF
jgi:hypothetical protein